MASLDPDRNAGDRLPVRFEPWQRSDRLDACLRLGAPWRAPVAVLSQTSVGVPVSLDGVAALPCLTGRPLRRQPVSRAAAPGVGNTAAWRRSGGFRGRTAATVHPHHDDLDVRGLRRPEFVIVDGAAGLEAALLAQWGENLPIQRCQVHKHRNLLAHAPKHMQDEPTEDYRDMIHADTAAGIEMRRKAFLRKWRLKCRAVAGSLEEAGDRLFTFMRLDPSQWKSARTTNATGRLNEEFRRRIKTRTVPSCAETVTMLLWALLASGQIQMRKVDGWHTVSQPPEQMRLDLAAWENESSHARKPPPRSFHSIRDTTPSAGQNANSHTDLIRVECGAHRSGNCVATLAVTERFPAIQCRWTRRRRRNRTPGVGVGGGLSSQTRGRLCKASPEAVPRCAHGAHAHGEPLRPARAGRPGGPGRRSCRTGYGPPAPRPGSPVCRLRDDRNPPRAHLPSAPRGASRAARPATGGNRPGPTACPAACQSPTIRRMSAGVAPSARNFAMARASSRLASRRPASSRISRWWW